MAITYVGAAAGDSGQAAVSPVLPVLAGIVTGDLLVMVVETANQAVTISDAGGGTWTSVTAAQGTGTAAGTTATRCHVFWSIYDGAQTAPTIADAGDHVGARIYAYRGVDPTSPINAATGNVDATSDNSLSATGVTTTAPDCWVLVAATLMDDAQNFGATWTNANLTGITVRDASFGHTSGNDGRLILVDGVKATAGATGNTTNTLTANSVKAMVTFALTPATEGGAATLTPATGVFAAVAVTPTPQPVTTTITPVEITLVAVELTGAGGPATLSLTPVSFRADAVPVTPTPQPVTTEIVPADATLETGRAVVPLIESFDKANGTPLGPDRTWARHIYLATTQFQIVSNQARLAVTSAAADLAEWDLQVPSPNIAGIPNQQATITFTSVDHPDIAGYGFGAGLILRFALYNSDTNFRGYAIGLSWNDTSFPDIPGVWLLLGRYDASDQFTVLSVDAIGADAATLPGTLTARADGNQISGRFVHGGTGLYARDLAVAATDTTWTDGDVALLGQADLKATDTAQVTVDDLYAYTAPTVPATVNLRLIPPSIVEPGYRFVVTAVPIQILNAIDALDSATPPTDIYDAGDTATPPTDINDPEVGLVDILPLTLHVDTVSVSPVGSGPSQTPITPAALVASAPAVTPTPGQVTTAITPAMFTAVPVAVTPVGSGPGEATLTPVAFRADAVPVTSTPGQVTTTITPVSIRTDPVAVSPLGSGPGASTLTPVILEATAVAVTPVGVGPGAVTLVPAVVRVIAFLFETYAPVQGQQVDLQDPVQAVTLTDPTQALTFTTLEQTLVLVDSSHAVVLVDSDHTVELLDRELALAF